MTLLELVEGLESKGVELWVQEGRLRYRGGSDVLTPEILAELKDRKPEILALQRERTMRSTLCPLSHGQSALCLLHELAPESPAYNVGFAARVRSPLNIPAMKSALQTLTTRYESLRTTFPKRDSLPIQEIHKRLLPGFETIGATGVNDRELIQAVVKAYERPFDLERGPLLRVCVFTVSDSDHILMLSAHHLVCDAWSLWQLLEELGACYLQEQGIAAPALPSLTVRYSDYVRWQRKFLSGPEGERLLAFWKGCLSGELPILNLPTDRPRPAVQTFRGSSIRFQLSASLTSQIKALALAEGATLYAVLLAAFEILIHRYSGQDEIIIGSPMSGRTQREFADVIGNFVNTVALRSSSAGDPTFRDFLAKTIQMALDGIAHQDFPFSLLVEHLRIPRDPSRTPLFQVLFNFLKPQRFQDVVELWVGGETGKAVNWGGLSLIAMSLPQQEGQFDLTLEMIEGKASLFGFLKYNTDIYDEETIVRMVQHFETLLQSIANGPDKSLSALDLLPEAERRKLLVEWNNTRVNYPTDLRLHDLIERQAQFTPEAVAVSFEGQQLTYRQLEERANQLARRLQKLGVREDMLVGICVERSIEMIIGLMGILKSGGAYVPLDPENPKERMAFMLEDAGMSVLLTQARLEPLFPPHKARVLRLDADWSEIANENLSKPFIASKSEDLAYMIYTSGSTGRPKGAMITHRGIVNRLLWMQDAYRLTPEDRVLQKTPFSFDVSVWEFFWPLMVGARLVVAIPGGHRDGAYLTRQIEKEKITTLHFVPSMLSAFLEEEGLAVSCASVKRVICSGEALPFELQQRFFERLPAQLHNLYGPTEASVDVTSWACQRDGHLRIVPIGRPIANTQIYIVDHNLQPRPIGIPGELCIGGVGLARGYHNRPELTAERFVLAPFSVASGARLYRTGDLARYLPDGNVEYLGRIDFQVKIRGFRVELGEIEETLRRHPAIQEAVVVTRELNSGDKRLVAYVVSGVAGVTALEIRNVLRENLPDYMVPSQIVFLAKLPLSPNGKIDRKALPLCDINEDPSPGSTAPIDNEAESKVVRAWQEILPTKRVGRDDNFFDLGGNSLLLIRVRIRLEGEFGRQIPMVDMFKFTTVRALAEYLSGENKTVDAVQDALARVRIRKKSLQARRPHRLPAEKETTHDSHEDR